MCKYCHCEARLTLSQRGNLLESNLISNGAFREIAMAPDVRDILSASPHDGRAQ